ncbi:Bug family tripartite tricarboxylate transporter substrate binding protein [Mariluticola halotolerans]|uniref:Bug family tripartite tricarboxylate transporter substrate binding protein n=1 Tax=Mariluticola halotolerans TaxID=2909283 RepID=UPI0026E154AC|nr:tripartite tricarboxylate transporter substrate binding protein [Mariluticola halotolerans]UJQ93974.1 tripartite tricarboxylate transporter substrate binding protein [Mariluticola halotolerans]
MKVVKNLALAFAATLMVSGTAMAQYPERPIELIIPWSAGGGTDATGRIIATMLEEKLGQPITINNRTGGGGIVGHEAIKEANPDGYTLGIVTTELSMFKPVGSAEMTYEDYTLIGLYNADPSAIFVSADSKFQSMQELAEAIKADPAALKASGASFGGLNHLSWVSLVHLLGAPADKAFWVPTDGAVPSLQLLASGAIDVAVSQFPEAQSLVDAGEIRPLGYLGNEANPKQPDVPPITDALGLEFAIAGWRGLGGPKGMPDDVVATLTEALDEIVNSAEFAEFMDSRNYGVVWEGGSDFEEYLRKRGEAFDAAISSAGITAQ